jgi:hypothetical protein
MAIFCQLTPAATYYDVITHLNIMRGFGLAWEDLPLSMGICSANENCALDIVMCSNLENSPCCLTFRY